tara:strand:+ start:418 stop:681 length:264 start_codon:yes stop_codon:yes gene_type:complete
MKKIGQGVDNRNGGTFGEFLYDFMAMGTNDQTVEKAGKDLNGIRNAFPSTNLSGILIQDNGMSAKFPNAHLERDPSAGAVLVKEQSP